MNENDDFNNFKQTKGLRSCGRRSFKSSLIIGLIGSSYQNRLYRIFLVSMKLTLQLICQTTCLLLLKFIIEDHVIHSKPDRVPSAACPVNKIRWDKADLHYYYQETGNKLVSILESVRQPYNKIVDSFTIFNNGLGRDDYADD